MKAKYKLATKINRIEAIEIAGKDTVEALDGVSCEIANETNDNIVYSAIAKFGDANGMDRALIAYYLVDKDWVNSLDDDTDYGELVDWRISYYEVR